MNDAEKIQSLLELLDSDNEQSAGYIMAELLQSARPDLVNQRLCDLQETPNRKLRKRIHQLQSAIGARYLRYMLGQSLRDGSIPLLDGAIRLHLCWFDNDTFDNVAVQWNELCSAFMDAAPGDLREFAAFMVAQNFRCTDGRDDLEPESYCIGCVLDHMPGSDLMLSLIVSQLTAYSEEPLQIVRRGLDFAVRDVDGNLLLPGEYWRVIPGDDYTRSLPEVYDASVLRMIAAMLFQAAVSSDGFRYMYTIGSALAAALGKDDLKFLPYPYNNR